MTKRRQLQARRRTLQTISELSPAEVSQPLFRSPSDNEEHALLSPSQAFTNTNKRRSLPQNCPRFQSVQIPVVHIMTAQRSDSYLRSHGLPQPEVGWNARREQARRQAEQALSGTAMRPQHSYSDLRSGNMATKHLSTSPLHSKSSQPYLRSYYSQHHLLQDNRAPTTSPSSGDHQSSTGRSPKHGGLRDHNNTPISERHSTDSSSYPSSHGSSVQRSRSSSSSQSFTLQDVPPLPSGCAQPTRTYYTAISSRSNKSYPFQLPGPMYTKAPPDVRTSSLPQMREDHHFGRPLVDQIPDTPNTLLHHRYKTAHRSRAKSVSSRSATSEHRKYNARSSLPSQAGRRSVPKPPMLTSNPSLASHPVAQRPRVPKLQTREPTPSHQPGNIPRTTPSRTSLPKWHANSNDTKRDVESQQRARIKERVRRANEMEQQKEKELQAVGLGAEKGPRVLGVGLKSEKPQRGCFGGVWRRILGRVG